MNIEEIRIKVAELQNQYVSVIKSLLALMPHADPNICQKQVRAFTQELLSGLEGKGGHMIWLP